MKTKILLAGVSIVLFAGLCLSVAALREAGGEIARVKAERDQAAAQIAAYQETVAKARMELSISQLAVKMCREENSGLRASVNTPHPVAEPVVRLEDFQPGGVNPMAKDPNAELLRLALKLLM